MYKVEHDICPRPVHDLFNPSLRGNHEWAPPRTRTVNYGIETIWYLGPKNLNLGPAEHKSRKALAAFSEKSRNGNPATANVGFALLL